MADALLHCIADSRDRRDHQFADGDHDRYARLSWGFCTAPAHRPMDAAALVVCLGNRCDRLFYVVLARVLLRFGLLAADFYFLQHLFEHRAKLIGFFFGADIHADDHVVDARDCNHVLQRANVAFAVYSSAGTQADRDQPSGLFAADGAYFLFEDIGFTFLDERFSRFVEQSQRNVDGIRFGKAIDHDGSCGSR